MRIPSGRRAAVVAVAASSVLLSTYLLSAPATAEPKNPGIDIAAKPLRVDPDKKVDLRLNADPKAAKSVFVQLSGVSAAEAADTEAGKVGANKKSVTRAGKTRQAQVEKTADSVTATAEKADADAEQIFTVTNGLPGVAVHTDPAGIKAMAARRDVVRITPLSRYRVQNASTVQLTKTLKTWQDTGLTGEGIRVGVMDTGIDYTHADFGGEGTVEAYEAALATDTEAGWETDKVVGGYDFAGNLYNASADAGGDPGDPTPVPAPDPNPLDCNGHGTHVAGTAAGFGVNADGSTYTGSYRSLTKATLDAMRIGPGTAPEASLYALRVFGCDGSTDLVMPALDWALDPNGDGNFSDHLDILNMSLGADFDAPDDPTNTLIDRLARQGVMTVNSAGNAGDFTDAGSAARRALTVASTVDAYDLLDGLIVNAPATVAGTVAGQTSVAYPWATAPDVTGTVAALSSANADGCVALTGADADAVDGKVAWLVWDDNDATRTCGSVARSANVKAAGAIGALFTTETPEFFAGITGDAEIPVFQLNAEATDKLAPAVQTGQLQVTFTGSLLQSVKSYNPAAVDMVSQFTSRGTHGAPGTVKPDVAAPGNSIVSAGFGTGNDLAKMQGTSMASPHVAGIAALVKSKHPTWSVQRIKAAIMNTAVHNLFSEPGQTGDKYGPNRVGSGRVDAKYATSTSVLAYSKTNAGLVSVSFGVVEAPITKSVVRRSQQVTVRNTASKATWVSLSYSAVVKQPGVRYSVSPSVVRLPANSTRTVKVTMTVQPSKLRRTMDPTMSATSISDWTGEGARQYVSDASGNLLVRPLGRTPLRVPVYGAAKPVSMTKASVGDDVITLKGKGVEQGSGSEQYFSKASLLTLGATSRRMPTCVFGQVTGCALNATARSSDLRYTSAGYVQEGATPDKGVLWFGVSMWGNAPIFGNGWETDVVLDVDGDDEVDYVVAAFTPNNPNGSDQPIALLLDGEFNPISAFPINFLEGDVDTNFFDNDTFLVPVWAADIGVDAADTSYPIRYATYTFNPFDSGSAFDSTDWVDYDVVNPTVKTDAALYADLGGEEIPYTATAPGTAAAATTNGEAPTVDGLLIHLGGRTGHRAEVVKLETS